MILEYGKLHFWCLISTLSLLSLCDFNSIQRNVIKTFPICIIKQVSKGCSKIHQCHSHFFGENVCQVLNTLEFSKLSYYYFQIVS